MGPIPSPERRDASRARPILAALVAAAAVAGLAAASRAAAQGASVPLPPPPPGTTLRKQPAPAQAPEPSQVPSAAPTKAAPAVKVPQIAAPPPAPGQERCVSCHGAMLRKRVVHQAVQADNCSLCHKPAAKAGKCRSKTATGWVLTKDQPDLCYSCHKRKDTAKEVHTAVRVGECLECHAAHASDLPALAKRPREQMCFSCHEYEGLVAAPVKHAPVGEGQCLDCHDPHGTDVPKAVRASGKSLCLRCHEQSSPAGKGTPGPDYRIDFKKAVAHKPVRDSDCSDCHVGGHGGENPKLLKKPPPELCYGCHNRQDTQKYVHGAVLVGDCAVCHAPHTSAQPKLLARDTQKDLCFICHQDDVTGRTVLHKPVAEGKCQECHGAHGAPNRWNLVKGGGKQTCYACHKPMDQGKVKHGALERYGCTGCHDPHGAAGKGMLSKSVNALCVTCHADKPDGRHVSNWIATGHIVSGGLDPRRPGREFSCASCHNPHGSDFPKLFYLGDSAIDSCAGCHGDKTGRRPDLKPLTQRYRQPAPGAASAGSGAVGGGGADSPGGAPAPALPAPAPATSAPATPAPDAPPPVASSPAGPAPADPSPAAPVPAAPSPPPQAAPATPGAGEVAR